MTERIDLSNLATATPQAIFNQSVRGVIRQRAPSIKHIGKTPVCLYRAGDGLACAAGHLISDEDFRRVKREECDRANWASLTQALGVFKGHDGIITSLQDAHDRAAAHYGDGNEEEFLDRFKEFALHAAVVYRVSMDEALEGV